MDRELGLPCILIVADDLTGALDSAVAFAGAGRRVAVARGVDGIDAAMAGGADVLAVNTASREGSEAHAIAAIGSVARRLPLRSIPTIIKKVDSRLKGHVQAEVRELVRRAGRDRIVGVPAIPGMGRIQEAGRLTGAGIDRAIDLAGRLGEGVETPDVTTDAALDRVVAEEGTTTLWVGARGLTFAIARARYAPAPAHAVLPGPALFAIGSRDPVTVAQVARLDHAVEAAADGAVPTGTSRSWLDIVVMTEGGTGRSAALAGAAFADGIAARMQEQRVATLLVCGGETAEAIMDRLGIGSLDVLAEVAPGLPVSVADVPWGRLHIATKSGGFGAPDLLGRIVGMVGGPECAEGLS